MLTKALGLLNTQGKGLEAVLFTNFIGFISNYLKYFPDGKCGLGH